jgi:DNA polymerase-3 subunit delta
VKLNPGQLSSHLSSGVAPVYLISGDEPLLVDETRDAIRAAAGEQGIVDREIHVAERSFNWDEFAAGLQNLSLFATHRLVELRLPTGKPGDKGARFLAAVAGEPIPDTVLVVITPGLDSRTAKSKWASSLARDAVWIVLRAPGAAALPKWIAGRLHAAGLEGDPEALELLAARVEGNLLAAKQEIDKLVLLAENDRVTIDTVRAAVADGARFDVFQLTDAALAGDRRRAARILNGLHREGVAAPLVMWSLAREIGLVVDIVYRMNGGSSAARAMTDAGVWRSRQSLIGRAVRALDLQSARRLLVGACHADCIVKGARRGQAWNALLEVTLALAGNHEMRAETA